MKTINQLSIELKQAQQASDFKRVLRLRPKCSNPSDPQNEPAEGIE
jgi:hypothetical protein